MPTVIGYSNVFDYKTLKSHLGSQNIRFTKLRLK